MAIKYTGFFDVKIIDTGYIMKDDNDTVTSKETAEQECRKTVAQYNATLRKGESPREFLKLNRVDETFVPDPKVYDDDDNEFEDVRDVDNWEEEDDYWDDEEEDF